MKHIRTFESYKSVKSKLGIVNDSVLVDAIKESVLQVGDLYKVRSMVDIPQSLINSYVKKVKDTTGKNLRQFFGDVEIAEQLLQFITTTGLDIDKIPGNALMGGAQSQSQSGVQVQTAAAETGETEEIAAQETPAAQTTETPTAQETQTAQTTETPAAQETQAAQTTETPAAQETQAAQTTETPAAEEFEEPAKTQEEEEEENEEELPL